MTKKEALLILQDQTFQIIDLADFLSDNSQYEWIGDVLNVLVKDILEAIDALKEEK